MLFLASYCYDGEVVSICRHFIQGGLGCSPRYGGGTLPPGKIKLHLQIVIKNVVCSIP
jgi:hypothetical protein